MNDEFEHGELITDWSTVKQGDIVCREKHEYFFLEYLAFDKKRDLAIFRYCNYSHYIDCDINAYDFYRAIPKKKKIVKYLYEILGSTTSITNVVFRDQVTIVKSELIGWFKDDEDFKVHNPLVKEYDKKVWTAREFDE